MPTFFKKQPILRYIPLGGAGTVTRNMHVYELADEILIIDCGVGFPEAEQPGVDIVIPDVSYLQDKARKIKGILVSHAHEDHFGALPYLIEDLGFPPIFAARLPLAFIKAKLAEFGITKKVDLNEIEPAAGSRQIGQFKVVSFRVNHSVPDALGFVLQTPVGTFVYVADFKFDWTPVDGRQFDVARLVSYTQQGVRCLTSDCLGATSQGYTESEQKIQASFEKAMMEASGQVFITTVSSNISRIQQAINASIKFDRKIAVVGRSIEQKIEIARQLNYLNAAKDVFVPLERAKRMRPEQLTYLIAGSYAQPHSALQRLAAGENRFVRLAKNATVIFSADPIPGVYDQVGNLVDKLSSLDARVIYSEMQEDLHVSGHGSRGDLAMMAALVRPKNFIPIGGNTRHARAYAEMIEQMGFPEDSVLDLKNGQIVEFSASKVHLGKEISVENIYVDGSLVGDVKSIVLRDRLKLSEEGIFVVIVSKGKKGRLAQRVEIVSRGFIYMAESDKLIQGAKRLVLHEIREKHVRDWSRVKLRLENKLGDYLFKKTSRRPMLILALTD